MTAPERIWAWPWEVNPNMGQWETVRAIVGDGTEYILHTPAALAASPLVQEIVAEAVKSEREACAKVAHDAGKPYARAFIMRRLAGLGYNISVRSKQRMCVRIAAAIRARGEGQPQEKGE